MGAVSVSVPDVRQTSWAQLFTRIPRGLKKKNTTNLVSPENNSFVATLTCVSGLGNRGSNTTRYKLEMKMSDTPPACVT